MQKYVWQDLGLKCQTPLRLKAWVEEMEVFFYLDYILDPVFLFIKDDCKALPLKFGNS